MRIEVVTIGDELLLGFTIDTNAAHLARALAAEGIEVARRTTCGATAASIADAAGDALERTGAGLRTGIGESHIADLVTAIPDGLGDVELAYLPNADGTDLRVTVRGAPRPIADARLALAAVRLRSVVGSHAYGEDATDLAAVVLDLCRAQGLTVAVAESCTGRLLRAPVIDQPGSSDGVP